VHGIEVESSELKISPRICGGVQQFGPGDYRHQFDYRVLSRNWL